MTSLLPNPMSLTKIYPNYQETRLLRTLGIKDSSLPYPREVRQGRKNLIPIWSYLLCLSLTTLDSDTLSRLLESRPELVLVLEQMILTLWSNQLDLSVLVEDFLKAYK